MAASTSLQVLGCRAGSPSPDSACSGYLLHTPAGRILIDCGSGIAAQLARLVGRASVDAIVVTHTHADHSLDLVALAYALQFPHPRPEPIPLWLPTESLDYPAALDAIYGIPTLPELAHPVSAAFDVRPLVRDGYTPVEPLAGVTLTAFPSQHAVPTAALRIQWNNTVVSFSSDTGWSEAVIEAARSANLFVCEATYARATEKELKDHGHLTGEQAGCLAAKAGVKSLLLTHLADPDHAETIRAQALAAGDLPPTQVGIAYPNLQVPLAVNQDTVSTY